MCVCTIQPGRAEEECSPNTGSALTAFAFPIFGASLFLKANGGVPDSTECGKPRLHAEEDPLASLNVGSNK